jgi:hypothetical protein
MNIKTVVVGKLLNNSYIITTKQNNAVIIDPGMEFDKIEKEKDFMETANMQANRCPFPPSLDDCPVIKYLRHSPCEECKHVNHQI